MKKKLTPKQRLFCKAYLVNGYNATQAAITSGYSEKTAHSIGPENLGKPEIKEFLNKRMAEIEKKLDIKFEQKAELLWKAAMRCYGPTDEEVEVAKFDEDFKAFFEFHPSGLVSAIAELNKMQGDHAPQKTETKHDDEQFKQLLKEHEREY